MQKLPMKTVHALTSRIRGNKENTIPSIDPDARIAHKLPAVETAGMTVNESSRIGFDHSANQYRQLSGQFGKQVGRSRAVWQHQCKLVNFRQQPGDTEEFDRTSNGPVKIICLIGLPPEP